MKQPEAPQEIAMKHTCCGKVWPSGAVHSYKCGVTAKYEHEGRWYCKTHHPPAVQAKRDASNEKYRRQLDEARVSLQKADAERAEIKRRAALFPELLEALRWIERRCPAEFLKQEPHVIHTEAAHDAGACARAAIAKAEEK